MTKRYHRRRFFATIRIMREKMRQVGIPAILGYTLVLITIQGWYEWTHRYDGLLQFVVLSAGQGTAVYIRTPNGVELLYDTGPTTETLRELGSFRPFYDRSLDYVIASHADLDHIGMLPRMLRSYQIDRVIVGPGTRDDSPLFETVFTEVEQYSSKEIWHQGDVKVIDEKTYLEVLHPEVTETASGNDESLVLLLHHGNHLFLLTGDISRTVERQLVRQYGSRLDSDVFLVSHHGSRTSSDETFIRAVSPEVAIVSAGPDNRYGHPHQQVTDRFATLGVPVLRTDQVGSIKVLSNGQSLLVQYEHDTTQ